MSVFENIKRAGKELYIDRIRIKGNGRYWISGQLKLDEGFVDAEYLLVTGELEAVLANTLEGDEILNRIADINDAPHEPQPVIDLIEIFGMTQIFEI